MVQSGMVSATVVRIANPLMTMVTVAARSWHTQPAQAVQVPNGQLTINGVTITLPVPPAPQQTGSDLDSSGLGEFGQQISYSGPNSTILSTGPNAGFIYWATPLTFSTFFAQYIINPDLVNQSSTFSQSQCGNFSTSNQGGFISWANLLAQTQRHEYDSNTQSHWAFYMISLNANNLGDFFEGQVAAPGTSSQSFADATGATLNQYLQTIATATAVEPFAVNDDAMGNFLGNINYAPYTACSN